LPLFKVALEANPKVEQFWQSYIEALIKEHQHDTAKQVIAEGRKQGFPGVKLDVLEAFLTASADGKVPPQAEMNELLKYYQAGRYGHAEKLAVSITREFPEHPFGWKVLGAVLKQTGRISESLTPMQRSIKLAPKDAEAHNNLGNTFKELGRLIEAEASYTQAIEFKPDYAEAHNNLGATLQELGRLDDAEASHTQAIELKPGFAEAHSNLGVLLQELGRLDEAEARYTQAIALKPDFAEAHNNLGNRLKEKGQLDEAKASYTQAVAFKPDYAEAHNNLGAALQELGRLDEAEASYAQAISLKPDYAEAHNNLGITLKELGKFDKSEASYTQAIALKPDFAEAHSNLGALLKELGRLEEAEASYTQVLALKPDFAEAYNSLGITSYIKGDMDAAIKSIEKAYALDPVSKPAQLLLGFLKSRELSRKREPIIENKTNPPGKLRLATGPLILNREVESELISTLYEMNSRELDETSRDDARYGNGICSPDFNFFEEDRSIIKTVSEDLTNIMMEAVKTKIYIYDSFFNILSTGGGTTPHNHLNPALDNDVALGLGRQKYSLVYYLSVGDQNCSDPGILQLYNPVRKILPCKGMITIIPASRPHSAVYGGKADRVMIGVNFYSL